MYSGSEETYSGPDDSSSITGSLFGALTTFVMIISDSSSLELSESLRFKEGVRKMEKLENKSYMYGRKSNMIIKLF